MRRKSQGLQYKPAIKPASGKLFKTSTLKLHYPVALALCSLVRKGESTYHTKSLLLSSYGLIRPLYKGLFLLDEPSLALCPSATEPRVREETPLAELFPFWAPLLPLFAPPAPTPPPLLLVILPELVPGTDPAAPPDCCCRVLDMIEAVRARKARAEGKTAGLHRIRAAVGDKLTS